MRDGHCEGCIESLGPLKFTDLNPWETSIPSTTGARGLMIRCSLERLTGSREANASLVHSGGVRSRRSVSHSHVPLLLIFISYDVEIVRDGVHHLKNVALPATFPRMIEVRFPRGIEKVLNFKLVLNGKEIRSIRAEFY